MKAENETKTIDPEVVEDKIVEFRKPSVPVTLNDIAALKGEAQEIIEARIQVLESLRRAAIRATHPEDWLLFKAKDNRVTGYLQDAGADRVRDLYGIEVFDISRPEKVMNLDGSFMYLITGSGRCRFTMQTLEGVEGGRSSTDDFCKDRKGVDLELTVRKAARANLDGNITRELAGLKSVPVEELETVWKGTNKLTKNCHYGRGFGSGKERAGARVEDESGLADQQKPKCGLCGKVMSFRPAGKTSQGKAYGAFWSCSDYEVHKKSGESQNNYSVSDEDWRKSLATSRGGEDIPV